jgi:Tol biopolymer transport system component/tRNA A-37 threonylcarbamoyl transferase component Bud32
MSRSVTAGSRIGPYEIVALIGAGGMGEVYRARDTRLSREVAVKVLPRSFADDPARMRRFEQEARAAGMLNHPNILAVYDIGTHEGSPYVVSELLEGQTLRERIDGSPLPPRKAIEYAIQIARGLAAAHEKGIVHRDLKPDNVFITREGRVKILDFGLAKVSPQAAMATAETALLGSAVPTTDAGMVLGTVNYMSPEQVRAQPADHRSDIFSFGLVLYEMLTGRQAFKADSAIETMSAILKADPPRIADTVRDLPPALERIVLHCLEKAPEERFQAAGDLAFDLETLSQSWSSGTLSAPITASRRPRKVLAAAVVLAAAGAGLFFAGRATAPVREPEFERLTFRRGLIDMARFAPNGRSVVYAAEWDGLPNTIYTVEPGNPESRSLDIEGTFASVSPKNELALLRPGLGVPSVLARIPMGGGAPREILEGVITADWSPGERGGSNTESIAVVRMAEGRQRLEFPIGHVLHEPSGFVYRIRVSRSGSHIAFAEHPMINDTRGDVCVVDLNGNKKTLSTGWEDVGWLAWSPDGREIWFSAAKGGVDHRLYAVTLDGRLRRLLSGAGSLRLQDVSSDGRVLIAQTTIRPSITVRVPGGDDDIELAWMDFSALADLSDDGKYVLFSEQGEAGGAGYSVYLRPTDGSPAVRLGKGNAFSLSHDGRWVLAVDPAAQNLVLLPTGPGQPRVLEKHDMVSYSWAGFFPDDTRILLFGTGKDGASRVYVQPIDSGEPPRPITPPGVGILRNTLTPDGKWVAARASSRIMLYPVDGGTPRPVPGSGPEDVPIRWNRDGRILYIGVNDRPLPIYAVDVVTGRRTLVHRLVPRDAVGASAIADVRLTADGRGYAFWYFQTHDTLYQITGLR